jgi:hypothetical protein
VITPTKYLKLEVCTLNVAANAIEILRTHGAMKYVELHDRLVHDLGDGTRYEFLNALGLLFLLGRVEYVDDSDSLCLISDARPQVYETPEHGERPKELR